MKYPCFYFRKEFSRLWNKNRHVRHIHRKHSIQDFNPPIIEVNEFATTGPPSIEIELPRLLFKIGRKLIILRRFFKNPNLPLAIMYANYYRSSCISTNSSKPLDDILARLKQRN